MAESIKKIKKRDGRIVDFDLAKVARAIFKSMEAQGEPNFDLAQELAKKVLDKLEALEPSADFFKVEQIQDIVEQILVEEGQAKIAKAYIIYRQKRSEIRKQKQQILQKEEIDEVDKVFDLNSLRVLCSRYLKKDAQGHIIEPPKALFERVALHVLLPSLFYSAKIYQKEKGQKQIVEEFDCQKADGKYALGHFVFNQFHLEALKRLYDRFNEQAKMKVSFSSLLEMLAKGQFDDYQKEVEDYFQLMVKRKFFPNTPALVNFGNHLGMGSACFHPSQIIITQKGPKLICHIKEGDLVLTHRHRFRKVTKVFSRQVNEELYKISVNKLPNTTLFVTKEHPILTYNGHQPVWQKASNFQQGDFVALAYPKEVIDIRELKINDFVDNLVKKGDQVFYSYQGGKFNAFKHETTAVKNKISVDYDLMKLFGFYLSEGCVTKGRCLRFTFSSDEEHFAKEVLRIVNDKFGLKSRIEATNNPERNWISLRFHSTILAQFFETIFGTGFDKKIMPNWLLLLPTAKQLGLAYGMIRGDGTLFLNYNTPNARLVMCNKNLVYGFWQLSMRLDHFASLKVEKMPKLGTKNPVICTIGYGGEHLLQQFYSPNSIANLIGKNVCYYKNPLSLKMADGSVLSKIMKIEKVKYNGFVYNLEVEDDHSYVANMVAVHNCFVVEVGDSIESIMDALRQSAIIFKSGGGVGYNFSKLRPEGDFIKSTSGKSSGPLSFMSLFDKMTDVIKQGGVRRGASMGILNINHPDIEKFIIAKRGNQALRNFNISVLVKPDFWEHYQQKKPYPLRNPRDGHVVKYIDPQNLFSLIVYQAWESAEPGLIFEDSINEFNPFLKTLGPIVATNPCHRGSNRIHTNLGLVPIKDLVGWEFKVICPNGNIASATAFSTGVQSLYRVIFRDGFDIDLTKNHKLRLSSGEEKTIERLKPGDKIALSNQEMIVDQPCYNFSEMDGFYLGWNYGDGWITWNNHSSVLAWQIGFVFSLKEDVSIFNRFRTGYLRSYGLQTQGTWRPERGVVEVALTNKKIRNLFFDQFLATNKINGVPETVMRGNKDFMIGFLRGLFASDGNVTLRNGANERSRRITLTSAHRKLIRDVRLLLSFFGIISRIRESHPPYRGRHVTRFDLTILGNEVEKFAHIIGFPYSERKSEVLQHSCLMRPRKGGNSRRYAIVDEVRPLDIKEEVYNLTVDDPAHQFVVNGIISANCGELPLYSSESCNLGSINLWAFCKHKPTNGRKRDVHFDWQDFKETIKTATKFLDNVVDVNKYPLADIEEKTLSMRKIGLGIMGLADVLYELELSYNTSKGLDFMEKAMEVMNYYSKVTSIELAKERGSFPFFEKSFYVQGKLPLKGRESSEGELPLQEEDDLKLNWPGIKKAIKQFGIRNAQTTTNAPTGSISMIAGTSSGIEPNFSLVFEKKVSIGSFYYVNPVFEQVMAREGLLDEELIKQVAENSGSIQNLSYIPPKLKKIFVTSMDIKAKDHIKALAVLQKWTDSAISKTINFPSTATVDDMREAYLLAYQSGCKGVTVFRDQSIQGVLNVGSRENKDREKQKSEGELVSLKDEKAKGPVVYHDLGVEGVPAINGHNHNGEVCPNCSTPLVRIEGCKKCPKCGWGVCSG